MTLIFPLLRSIRSETAARNDNAQTAQREVILSQNPVSSESLRKQAAFINRDPFLAGRSLGGNQLTGIDPF